MTRLLFRAALILACTPAAHAQDISLEKMLTLASLPVSLTPAQNQEAALAEWVFHPSAPLSLMQDEPLTWAWWPPANTPASLPGALLSLRANHGTFDLVLHFRRVTNFNQLHRECLRLKLPVTPVTCLDCQGERFAGPTYSVAFYQGKPEPYPYIVVLHQVNQQPAQFSPPATSHADSPPPP